MEKPLGLYKVCVVTFVYAKARNEEDAVNIVRTDVGYDRVQSAQLVTNPDDADDRGLDRVPVGRCEEEPEYASGRELIDHYNEQMKQHGQA
jgi:hypothetical protein